MNWIFVVHYWSILLDFGQILPLYNRPNFTSSNQNYTGSPDTLLTNLVKSEQLRSSPPTNNIFVNSTLFQSYSDYFYNTVILVAYGNDYWFPVGMMPVTSENQMDQTGVSLNVLYSCTDVALKSGISLVIAVLVADWAFISTFLTIVVFVGAFLETRGKGDGNNSIFSFTEK